MIKNSVLALAASTFAFAQFASADAIRIGVTTPIQLATGKDTVAAIEMAIEEINAAGGVLGQPLEMVVADETTSPQTGISAVQKLIDSDGADVLIGGYVSGVVLAQLPHIADGETIYLGVGGSSPSITSPVGDDYDTYKYIFRVSPPNAAHQAAQTVAMINEIALEELGYTNIAFLKEEAAWTNATLPPILAGLEGLGANVVAVESFEVSQSDFSPVLSRLANSEAEFVVTMLSASQSEILIKQWQDSEYPFMLGGIHTKSQAADYNERLGGAAVTEIAANLVLRAPISEKTIPFWDAFVERTGRTPVYTGPGAYDAVYIYAAAVEAAGTTDTDAVIEALEATDYVGTNGRVVFNENHDVTTGPGFANIIFAQWGEGDERAIVSPPELRDASTEVATPAWLQ